MDPLVFAEIRAVSQIQYYLYRMNKAKEEIKQINQWIDEELPIGLFSGKAMSFNKKLHVYSKKEFYLPINARN